MPTKRKTEDVDTTDTKEAVIAGVRHTAKSNILSGEELDNLSMTSERDDVANCAKPLQAHHHHLPDGSRYVTGNRCRTRRRREKKRLIARTSTITEVQALLRLRRLTDKSRNPRRNQHSRFTQHVRKLSVLVHTAHLAGLQGDDFRTNRMNCSKRASNPSHPKTSAIRPNLCGHIKWLLSKGAENHLLSVRQLPERTWYPTPTTTTAPVVANIPWSSAGNMPELREGHPLHAPILQHNDHELMVDRIVERISLEANVTREEAETQSKRPMPKTVFSTMCRWKASRHSPT